MNRPALRIGETPLPVSRFLFVLSSLAIISLTLLWGYSYSFIPLAAAVAALFIFWMSCSANFALSLYLLSFSFAMPLIDIGVQFYLDDFLFPLLLLYLLIYVFLERQELQWGRFGRTLLLFWIVALILTALNIWRFDGKQLLKSFFQLTRLLEYVFVYIIAHNLLREKKDVRRTLVILLLGATWVVVAGVYQWLVLNWNVILSTLSDNHAHIGVYVIIVFFFALTILMRSENFPVRFFLTVLLCLMLIVLVQSYSRAAWLGFAGAMALYIVLRRSPALIAIFLLGVIVIAAAGFAPEALSSRMDLTFQSRNVLGARTFDLSTLGRLYIWYGIAQMMMTPFNFLFGVGQGAFQFAIQPFVPIISDGASGAHNNILHIFSELGIIGLIVFITLLWRIFMHGIRAFRAARHRSASRDYAIAHLCIFVGLGVTMVSQETFSVQEANASFLGFYLFCLALLEKCIAFYENSEEPEWSSV